jgi:Rab-like protein 2
MWGQVTYQHLNDWYTELRENCPDIPCLLVANKIDVDYNVRRDMYTYKYTKDK